MKRIDLKTWEEFQTQVSQLDKVRSERKSATGRYVSEYLFRGQSDSLWSLKTTLERYTGRLLTLLEYYRVLCRAKPQIESFTDASWDKIPSLTEYTNQIGSEGYLPLGVFPAYEYFIYLPFWIPFASARLDTISLCCRVLRIPRCSPVSHQRLNLRFLRIHNGTKIRRKQ